MDRKSDSKTNVNESTLPLLDLNQEKIELEAKQKDSTETEEKTEAGETNDDLDAAKRKKEEEKERKRKLKAEEEEKKKQLKLEKKKKKEEEKELKKQQKAEKQAALEASKGTNGSVSNNAQNLRLYANQFTNGINFLVRDEKSINEHVNVAFEDVIGEPDATQGFEAAYRFSFGLFQFVRFWLYRVLMFIVSVPIALVWAVVFAFLSLLSVWVLTPAFRVIDILFFFVHRLWNGLVRTFLDPVFSSVSLLRQANAPLHQIPSATTSGRSLAYGGAKYGKLSTNEGAVSFRKSDEDATENEVTLNIDNI